MAYSKFETGGIFSSDFASWETEIRILLVATAPAALGPYSSFFFFFQDERRYSEFTRARKVSFLGHHFRLSQNFQEWILQVLILFSLTLGPNLRLWAIEIG